jgi:hypothetical protein
VINDTIAEDDHLIVQANATGIEGVLHEAAIRNGTLSEEKLFNRNLVIERVVIPFDDNIILPRDMAWF